MRNDTRNPLRLPPTGNYRFSNHWILSKSSGCQIFVVPVFSIGSLLWKHRWIACVYCFPRRSQYSQRKQSEVRFKCTLSWLRCFSFWNFPNSSPSANNSSIRFKTPPASIKWKKLFRGSEVDEVEFSDEDKENSFLGSDGRSPLLKFPLKERVACTTSKKRIHFKRRRPGAAEDGLTGGLKPCSVFTPLNKLK